MIRFIVLVVFALVCAIGAHVLAQRKGRSVKRWVVASLLIGPLSLLLLALMPKLKMPVAAGS
ncbi:MAG: hypothetical protein EXR11_03800 [Rhodospirillaceae bacterium]|nr:hypothetical protein [Rhodospirillaceae bacterium]